MSEPSPAGRVEPVSAPRAPLVGGTLALLILVASSLMLGAGHVFGRYAFVNGVPVLTASAARLVLTAVLLAFLLAVRRELPAPGWRRFWLTVPLGLLIVVQNVSIQTSVSLMPVGIAILCFYTYPLFTGIAATLLGEVRSAGRLAITLAAALAGLVLVLGVADLRPDPLGVALALLAALGFTTTLMLTPRLGAGLGAPVRTFLTMATAGLVIATLGLARGELVVPVSDAARIGLAGSAVCYALGIITLFLVLPRVGAVQVAVVMNLEPVLVALLAWGTLGEPLVASQLAGTALVIGAVIFYQAGAR